MYQLVFFQRESNANITRYMRHLSVKFIERDWLIYESSGNHIRSQ